MSLLAEIDETTLPPIAPRPGGATGPFADALARVLRRDRG